MSSVQVQEKGVQNDASRSR